MVPYWKFYDQFTVCPESPKLEKINNLPQYSIRTLVLSYFNSNSQTWIKTNPITALLYTGKAPLMCKGLNLAIFSRSCQNWIKKLKLGYCLHRNNWINNSYPLWHVTSSEGSVCQFLSRLIKKQKSYCIFSVPTVHSLDSFRRLYFYHLVTSNGYYKNPPSKPETKILHKYINASNFIKKNMDWYLHYFTQNSSAFLKK